MMQNLITRHGALRRLGETQNHPIARHPARRPGGGHEMDAHISRTGADAPCIVFAIVQRQSAVVVVELHGADYVPKWFILQPLCLSLWGYRDRRGGCLLTAMDIADVRRQNARRLVNEQFGGTQEYFAHAIDKTPSYVSRWFTESKHRRNIGPSSAREIESICGKPHGWLDRALEHNRQPAHASDAPAPKPAAAEGFIDQQLIEYLIEGARDDAADNHEPEPSSKELAFIIADLYPQLLASIRTEYRERIKGLISQRVQSKDTSEERDDQRWKREIKRGRS